MGETIFCPMGRQQASRRRRAGLCRLSRSPPGREDGEGLSRKEEQRDPRHEVKGQGEWVDVTAARGRLEGRWRRRGLSSAGPGDTISLAVQESSQADI